MSGLTAKIDLTKKGDSNPIEIKQLMATLKWTSADDFDLAAVYVKKNSECGLVYYGNQGSLASFPYMSLDEDAGVGATAGDNEENLRISKISDIKEIYLVCWDFEAAKVGKPANFKNSDVRLSIKDQNGNEVEAHLVVEGFNYNATAVAKIKVNSAMGIGEMVNISKGFVLTTNSDNGKDILNKIK